MKRFKLLSVAAILSLLASSCEKGLDGVTDVITLQSYVINYIDGPIVVRANTGPYTEENHYRLINISLHHGFYHAQYTNYTSPQINESLGASATEAEQQRFFELAEQHNDLSYNHRTAIMPSILYEHSTPAIDYKEVHVRCLNRTWDEELPAGSLIDERLEISYNSYSDFIASQYNHDLYPFGYANHRKPLTELAADDLSFIHPQLSLHARDGYLPASGTYELEVTFVTADGEERSQNLTLELALESSDRSDR